MGSRSIGLTFAPRLVAITGGSGSGKTFLANMLTRLLPDRAVRLTLDDFYLDRSSCPSGRRHRINYDHPRSLDWAAVEKALTRLARGRAARIPQYDFSTHTRSRAGKLVRPCPLIIVDGLWPLHRARIRRLFHYRIFLACPARRRFRRRLERDMAERRRSPASVRRQFLQTVSPMHRKYVAPQTRWSDLIVRRTLLVRDAARLAKMILQ